MKPKQVIGLLLGLLLTGSLAKASVLTYNFAGSGAGGLTVTGYFSVDTSVVADWDTAERNFFSSLDSFSMTVVGVPSSPASITYAKSDFGGFGVSGGSAGLGRNSGVFTGLDLDSRDDLGGKAYEISGFANWQFPSGEFFLYLNDTLAGSTGAPVASFQLSGPPVLTSVPEPSSAAILFGLGALSVASARRKR